MSDYKDLEVWKRSIDLTKSIYTLTSSFPDTEKFGLTNQMRRSSVSIPSNIAEGSARSTNKDFAHFLSIALGSACELETQVILSKELNFSKDIDILLVEITIIRKMINALKKSILK